jgi:hypothetical protein
VCGFYHDDFRCVAGDGQWRSVCLRALRGDVWDVSHPCTAGGREFGAACAEFGPGGLERGFLGSGDYRRQIYFIHNLNTEERY